MQNTYSRLKFLAILSVLLFFYAIAAAGSEKPSLAPLPLPFQQQEIRGVVSDNKGMPIPGVSVIIKGTNRGTVTNIDGEFTLTAPPLGSLLFSYLGYKSFEVAINGRREINIRLEDDISSLGEVEINAGYYNTTRRESTGNISRVTAEEIDRQPVISPLQALVGRMAGVEVIPGGSHPGMASTIRIRGINSLRDDGNFPLYIIDGMPINSTPLESNSLLGISGLDPLNTLNLSNIASIEVLKDADATAIYGSRGANGVILITTKKGRYGKTSLETQVYTGVSFVPNRLDLLNTEQYLQVRRQAFENDGVEPTASNAYDLVLWDPNRDTDWQDFFFGGTAETKNASFSLSGGKEKTAFHLGGSYFTKGTVFPGNYDYQKITGNFSLVHTSEDEKLNVKLFTNYGVDVNNLASNLGISYMAFQLPPNAPAIFNEDGNLNWEDWAEAGLDNPLAGYYNSSTTQTNSLLTNLVFDYQLGKGLSFKSNFGYTHTYLEEFWKRPKRSYAPSNNEIHNSFHLNTSRKSWIIEPQLTYDFKSGNLEIESIFGLTFQENVSKRLRLQGSGYASEALIGNLAAAEQILNASTSSVEYRYNAIFGRLGLNWKKRYYLNFTGRRDGSSRFGPDKRFANFGAIGAAWIFTEEGSFENALPFLSFGKLRGSYGSTGNDQIGDYGYLDAYEATRGPNGLYPTALANPEFSWEVNKKLEVAIELGLLRERVNFSLSWYRNRSSNQLVGYPLPAITGFSTVQANLPATVQNSGWELEGSILNFDTKSFRWKTNFNLSIPKNELVSYPELEQSSYANTYKIGHPLNISLLYKFEGLDPETGFYTIKDVNNDGRYDYEDRIVIQDQNRDLYFGVNNNLSFKNWSLQFLLNYVKQEGIIGLFNGGSTNNSRDVVLQGLSGEGAMQTISQSSGANRAYGYVSDSDFPVQDASFLRLRTLSLSYSFPKEWLQKLGMEEFQIYVNGQNLLTITPYEGLDPDFPYASTSFGNLRTVTGGLQFNF